MENFYKLNASKYMYILKMTWTAEIQNLNEDMIVAVVIAFFWIFFLGGVIYNCLNWNYHSDDHIFIFMSIVHFVSILGMKTFLLDGWHKPKLSSQNNVDVKLMHVWKVTEGQQSMSAKQWPVLLLFYSTPANINNYFSKRPWYSSPQECYFRVIVFASFHLRSVIFE